MAIPDNIDFLTLVKLSNFFLFIKKIHEQFHLKRRNVQLKVSFCHVSAKQQWLRSEDWRNTICLLILFILWQTLKVNITITDGIDYISNVIIQCLLLRHFSKISVRFLCFKVFLILTLTFWYIYHLWYNITIAMPHCDSTSLVRGPHKTTPTDWQGNRMNANRVILSCRPS